MKPINPSAVTKTGGGILRIARIGFFALFFIYLLLGIVADSIKQKDVQVLIAGLGEQFLEPLQNTQEGMIKLNSDIEQGFFKDVWDYLNLYSNFYTIFLWLWIFYKILGFLLKDTAPPLIRIIFTLFIFYTACVLATVLVFKSNPNEPFIATYDIFKNLIQVFSKI